MVPKGFTDGSVTFFGQISWSHGGLLNGALIDSTLITVLE